ADRGISLASANAHLPTEVGASPTLSRALALYDSNRRGFSLEFSLVAIFPSHSRSLRGRNSATATGLADCRGLSSSSDRCYDSDVDLPNAGRVRTRGDADLFSDRRHLVAGRVVYRR